MYAIIEKLKREWKTFALAIITTIEGALEISKLWGVDVPSLLAWVPEKYKSVSLFAVGVLFLLLRKYTPTTVIVQSPEPAVPEVPVA